MCWREAIQSRARARSVVGKIFISQGSRNPNARTVLPIPSMSVTTAIRAH